MMRLAALTRTAVRPPRRSLSSRLLSRVLSVYLLVTIGIVAVQLFYEYRRTEADLRAELVTLQRSFGDSIAYTLAHHDPGQLESTLTGIANMPSITHIAVLGPDAAVISETYGARVLRDAGWMQPTLFVSRRPLDLLEEGRIQSLGWLQIESDSTVIVERLQPVLAATVAGALIKSAVLIALFAAFFDQLLSRPLVEIARAASAIDPKFIDGPPIPRGDAAGTEIEVIGDAINALAAEVARTVAELDRLNRGLESQVQERTARLADLNSTLQAERTRLRDEVALRRDRELTLQDANLRLEHTVQALTDAQRHLIDAEKMAALGGLVAGISHEINTPIGLGVTAASHLQYMVEQLDRRYRDGKLDESTFERHIEDSRELSRAISVSLEKAAALVRSFKLVAVDQEHDPLRPISLRDYLSEILLTHQAVLHRSGVEVVLDCDQNPTVQTFPGAWSQILSNLIANSIHHGFRQAREGPRIWVSARIDAGCIELVYGDNGAGMRAEVAARIYEPFFTTRREGGGSGLGMHVVYNLVTQRLHGEIELVTRPGAGVCFTVRSPVEAIAVQTAAANVGSEQLAMAAEDGGRAPPVVTAPRLRVAGGSGRVAPLRTPR